MNSLLTCLTIYLALSLHTDVLGQKPRMVPDEEEIIIDEGDSLELICHGGSKQIEFHPPQSDTVTTSEYTIAASEIDGRQSATLLKRETVYGDTGYYGCSDADVFVAKDVYNQTNVRWIYVYVRSNSRLFVTNGEASAIYRYVGATVIIPCRPTDPHYNVTLTNMDGEIEFDETVSFDPRIGLILHDVGILQTGDYTCRITTEERSERQEYHVGIDSFPEMTPLLIDDRPFRHVGLGQNLNVNCSFIMMEPYFAYSLTWISPNPNREFEPVSDEIELPYDQTLHVSELKLHNIQKEDAGLYECKLTTHHEHWSTFKNLTIHDSNNKFIKLMPQHNNTRYILKETGNLTLVVDIDSYPEPALISWFVIDINNKETEINSSRRISIVNTTTSTILKIQDLKVPDMGQYLLRVITSDGYSYSQNATVNFTVEVQSRPYADDFNLQSYYLPNSVINATCRVVGYPAPHINWTFIPLNAMTEITLNGTEYVKGTETSSTVSLLATANGHLHCTSYNHHGYDIVEKRISISEVEKGFGIIPPKQDKVTVGDDIEMTCVAPIYNYTSEIVWMDRNQRELHNTDRIMINHTKSEFTYQATLRIKSAEKTDSQNYICKVKEPSDFEDKEFIRIDVQDTSEPYFLMGTDLNKSENVYSAGIDTVETIILNCEVGGSPMPTITWSKDDVPIDFSNASSDFSNDYTLVNNNQSLHINHLLERVSGTYTCLAKNKVGETSTWHKITIKGKEVPKVLIVLIILLVVFIVVLLVFFIIRTHRNKILRKQLMEAGLTHFEEGALECLNPELTVDDQAELLPYDKKWEFPRDRLKFGKQLGHGAFGVVMKAEAQGITEEEDVTTVAVKMVKRSTESIHIRALASELKIMVHLGKHLNVVNLLGACTKNIAKRELLVIVEYCRYGNLHNYLLRHRSDFVNQIEPSTGKIDISIGFDVLNRTVSVGNPSRLKYAALSFTRSLSVSSNGDSGPYSPGPDSQGVSMSPDGMVLSNNSIQPAWRSNYRGDYKDSNLKPICTQDLLSWAFQVARGMEYLSQRRVLHGDLAARNILLAEDNVVKICDFGLAKSMYKDDNYRKKGDAPLPIKWMAIESIRDRVFSTQSDIWSFGIVLWEFFTLAKTPYPGMEAEIQYQKLIEGYRMEKPEFATNDVYDIMIQCWNAKPILRPSFTDLADGIGNLLDDSVKMHYVDLNTPYMDMNTLIENDYLTMMSSPDHEALSSPAHYVNSPHLPPASTADDPYLCMSPAMPKNDTDDIFSPRKSAVQTHFDFPAPQKVSVHPDSDSETVELPPMMKNSDDDGYLQPINVAERRAEFAKQRQVGKNPNSIAAKENVERNSGYCNTPQTPGTFDLHRNGVKDETDASAGGNQRIAGFKPDIIRTQDNYVNMPRNKSDVRKDVPDSFTNPSYVLINTAPEKEISNL